MEGKHLLLSSAKVGVLVSPHHTRRPWRLWVLALGTIAVLVGGADMASRFSQGVFGERALFTAFAPAAALGEPSFSGAPPPVSSALIPLRLRIQRLGIDAAVEQVGKNATGAMANPSSFRTVGWYKLGAKPGEGGNAVFAGHVNNALTSAGVFEHLGELSLGDTVEVVGEGGKSLTFIVREISTYVPEEAPLEAIFATSGPPQVVLITCDGDWNEARRQFNKRLVVVAQLSSV